MKIEKMLNENDQIETVGFIFDEDEEQFYQENGKQIIIPGDDTVYFLEDDQGFQQYKSEKVKVTNQ